MYSDTMNSELEAAGACTLQHDVKEELEDFINVDDVKQEKHEEIYKYETNQDPNQDEENDAEDFHPETNNVFSIKEEPSEYNDEEEEYGCTSLCHVKLEDPTFQEDRVLLHTQSENEVYDGSLPFTSQAASLDENEFSDDLAFGSERVPKSTSLIACREQNCHGRKFSKVQLLRLHLQKYHGILFQMNVIIFASEQAFLNWKVCYEAKTNEYMLIYRIRDGKKGYTSEYVCARSGEPTQEHPNKLGFVCTSSMVVMETPSSTIEVRLYSHHYGHTVIDIDSKTFHHTNIRQRSLKFYRRPQ